MSSRAYRGKLHANLDWPTQNLGGDSRASGALRRKTLGGPFARAASSANSCSCFVKVPFSENCPDHTKDWRRKVNLLYLLGAMFAFLVVGHLYVLSKQLDIIIGLLHKIERSD